MKNLKAIEKAEELLTGIKTDISETDEMLREALLDGWFNKSLSVLQGVAREARGTEVTERYNLAVQGIFDFWGMRGEVPEPLKVRTLYERDVRELFPKTAVPATIESFVVQ